MGASCQMETHRNLGKYRLLDKLADGYLGPVFRAFDEDLGQAVAIRILDAGIRWDENVEARFYLEFHPVASLRHPNIAAIFGIDQEGQSPFIVTEYLDGSDLKTVIKEKTAIPCEEKLAIMIMVAEGLSHAHKNRVLHLNLSPGKIHRLDAGCAKVRDFDLAHILMRHLPYPSFRWGAPIYWSPEQIQHKECDERSDLFSAGIVFYEWLTGVHPFYDRNSNRALDNILFNAEIPTSDRFPDLPAGVWPILKKCLAKDPNDRFVSSAELSQACKLLQKDVMDELPRLHKESIAAESRLKNAPGQSLASKGNVRHLYDVQKPQQNEDESDYAFMDRLMSAQIDEPPAMSSPSTAPPAEVPMHPALLPEEPPFPATTLTEEASPPCEQLGQREELFPPAPSAGTIRMPADLGLPSESRTEAAESHTEVPDKEHMPLPEKETTETGAESSGSGLRVDAASGVEQQQSAAIPLVEEHPAHPIASPPDREPAPTLMPLDQISDEGKMLDREGPKVLAYRQRRIPRSAYKSAAVLLSILLIAVAVYLIRYRGAATFLPVPWMTQGSTSPTSAHAPAAQPLTPGAKKANASMATAGTLEETDNEAMQILLKEAQSLADQHRFDESKVFIRRILEINPTHEEAAALLNEIKTGPPEESGRGKADNALQQRLAHVSALISSGKLENAKSELDKLQQIRPVPPELPALRKRLEVKNSKMASELARKEEEQKKAARMRKEDDWTRRLAELLGNGKYGEARSVLTLWQTENPASARAQELQIKVEEVQRGLRKYESAMAENRYQDALAALGSAEQANPADSHFVELRRKAEARKAAARATLTVRRLGDKVALLLDGKPAGSDGEMESESITIGNHTLAIENEKGLVTSKSLEFFDGQSVVYVHDSAKRLLRPMVEADRELLALRRSMEEVHRFPVEHDHGWLRGNCRGELLVDYFEVKFKPASGVHGFRLPFKRLKLKTRGKSLDLVYASDDREFQNFKVQDAQAAEHIKRIWDNLIAMGR